MAKLRYCPLTWASQIGERSSNAALANAQTRAHHHRRLQGSPLIASRVGSSGF